MSKIPQWLAAVWLALLGVACGCSIPFSQHPTVQPSEAKVFPELYGAYRVEPRKSKTPQKPIYFHVGGAGNKFPSGFLRGIQVGSRNSQLEVLQFAAFAEKIGDYYVLNVPLPDDRTFSPRERGDSLIPWSEGWDPENATRYLLFRGSWDEQDFRLIAWNGSFIAEEIKADRLAGEVKKTREEGELRLEKVLVTAESAELRGFIEKHIEDPRLWPKEEEAILRRID